MQKAQSRSKKNWLASTLVLLGAGCDSMDVSDELVDDDDSVVHAPEAEARSRGADYPAFDPAQADEGTRRTAELATRVFLGDAPPPEVVAEAHELRLRFAHSLLLANPPEYFAARSDDTPTVEITYLGAGNVTDAPPDDSEGGEGVPLDQISIPAKYSDGDLWLVAFSGETQSEYEVRIPAELAQAMVDEGESLGIDLGSEGEGDAQPRGIVGASDTRQMLGQLNTAHTNSNFKRLVGFVSTGASSGAESSCSGALVGRHHVVTAAHCMYSASSMGGSWIRPTLRVGRNGTGWIDDADTSTGLRWFWIEATYKSAADQGSSPRDWDFGVVVTQDRHIGDSTGWFGFMYSNSEHDDTYNRGYPACFSAPVPSNCQAGHTYGDQNYCETGYFSSNVDSQGYKLSGYHSCDTSGGQSGSPIYRLNPSSGTHVIRGVHKGATHHAANSDDSDPNNSFALITEDRAAEINYLRSTFP